MGRNDGFTLIEVICVLAIVALLAALALPRLNPGTTPAQVDAYAVRIAALLKADRFAAMRAGRPVVTALSASSRWVKSGAGLGLVQLPADIDLDATLADRCAGVKTQRVIAFFPSGMSCGGVIALARPGASVEILVNWLTGVVEIVSTAKS